MGLVENYFANALMNLFTKIQQEKLITHKQKQEDIQKNKASDELQMSSSGPVDKKEEHKFAALLNKFSPEILAKLIEHGFNPSDITDARSAIKKLLNAGMPVEHVALDLQEHGKDIGRVDSLLSQHGLSEHSGKALEIALQNRSTTSAITYAEGLIEEEKPKQGLDFKQIA